MIMLNKFVKLKIKLFYFFKGTSTSRSPSQEITDSSQKRLSTIAESSSGVIEQNQEESGEFGSGQDVIV